MQREALPDGSIRLSSDRFSFIYTRLGRGVLLLTASGYDADELGAAALAEIDAEIQREGPVSLFVDTRDATGVTTTVRERWTSWLDENRGKTRHVTILVSSRFFELTVGAAKLFAGADHVRILDDVRAFEDAIARELPGFTRLPSPAGRLRARDGATRAPSSPDVTPIERAVGPNGAVRLTSGDGVHVITEIAPQALHVTIEGDDTEELTVAAFDEIEGELRRRGPLQLFVDLRGVGTLTASVRESWTAWFRAHRPELKGVSILVASTFLAEMVAVSKLISGTGDLIRLHSDARTFDAELSLARGRKDA